MDADVGAWVAGLLGSPPAGSRTLAGGTSSSVVALVLEDGRRVVCRTHTDTEWWDREPDLVVREAAALRACQTDLDPHEVRTPRLIATGQRRLAMTHVPGEVRIGPAEVTADAERLAALAALVHRVRAPNGVPPWRRWGPVRLGVPEWATHPGPWRLLADRLETPPPLAGTALLHRDLQPLNVLWDGDVPAVVDWVNAAAGIGLADLGHTRWNLAVLTGGPTAGDAFLAAYVAATGLTWDPWWDAAAVASLVDDPPVPASWQALGRGDLTASVVTARLEAFLRDALS